MANMNIYKLLQEYVWYLDHGFEDAAKVIKRQLYMTSPTLTQALLSEMISEALEESI